MPEAQSPCSSQHSALPPWATHPPTGSPSLPLRALGDPGTQPGPHHLTHTMLPRELTCRAPQLKPELHPRGLRAHVRLFNRLPGPFLRVAVALQCPSTETWA